jgi:hypothetical protein
MSIVSRIWNNHSVFESSISEKPLSSSYGVKIVYFLILIFNVSCTTQKERCYSILISFRGKSFDACSRYIGYEAISKNSSSERFDRTVENLKNYSLLDCLTLIEEEKKCEEKSTLVPHIGY